MILLDPNWWLPNTICLVKLLMVQKSHFLTHRLDGAKITVNNGLFIYHINWLRNAGFLVAINSFYHA